MICSGMRPSGLLRLLSSLPAKALPVSSSLVASLYESTLTHLLSSATLYVSIPSLVDPSD